jgi:hypothetical protein
MAYRETTADGRHTATTKGPGLARGPALIIGAILSAFGLILFLKTGDTSTAGFPDADVSGPTFLGFETNGWTAWFTTAAGALLLFGAAQHLVAKLMSLLVGLALGACAVLGFVDGDVLGLAAANFWTSLGWAIAAGLLLINVFMPRVEHDDDLGYGRRRWLGRRNRTSDDRVVADDRIDHRGNGERPVAPARTTEGEPVEPVTRRP